MISTAEIFYKCFSLYKLLLYVLNLKYGQLVGKICVNNDANASTYNAKRPN